MQNDEEYAGTENDSNRPELVSQYLLSLFSQGKPCLVPHTIQPLTPRDFRAVSCTTRDSLLLVLVLVVTGAGEPTVLEHMRCAKDVLGEK